MIFDDFILSKIVGRALQEDIGFFDVTTNSIFNEEEAVGDLTAKSAGVVAGLPVARKVWQTLDPSCEVILNMKDGTHVVPGQKIGVIKGTLRALLSGERVALNFLQRLSGIATLTSKYVAAVEGYPVAIVDTRKTTPGLRMLEKYAVRKGGGSNHRLGLDNAAMIKDNHIAGCGSITEAVDRVRKNAPITSKIELEINSIEQIEEALAAGVDIIMLDNMSPEVMREAVKRIEGRALIEASGGINLQSVREVASTGVNFISVGALTHSPAAMDISFNLIIG